MTAQPAGAGIPPGLVREWAACGIAAAAARFVPVPLLDDAVKERATRLAVGRTLRAAGRGYDVEDVEPLYDPEARRGLARAARAAARVPRKVLLFPVRKYVAVFGAVKGVPTDVMAVLLLGRAVHRALAAGRLAGPAGSDALRADALAVRRAFEEALNAVDLRMLSAALADVLSQGRGLAGAAVAHGRRLLDRDDVDDPAAPEDAVEAGAEQVSGVLRRPEVAEELDGFDRRFDLALGRRAP